MIKVAILLACLVGLTVAQTTLSDESVCKYEDELWGADDGLKFYFCDSETKTPVLQDCPDSTFFVRNETLTGCIPFSLMDPNCVYTVAVGSCTGNNLKQPQPSSDPSKFYLCTAEGATPLLLPCTSGKAFVKQNGYLGCFDWADWRKLRNCYTLTNQD
ncbi:uncharacterized protein LOC101460500 [Ceratitis capitata]|uniref:(Mediterranean fruit fly) hypothetical protein n=1 Tax=Ceratitis capitata TaxID=7213 RepID=A0A811U8C5_CERCA|nr:uncharacterized protein LOC101460500 [Ceratitis capitata]CAD6994207.1 unnamed protein product [Ceratitis capitata]